MWNLLQLSLSSIPWGIFIAMACMALFFVLIKGWYKDATLSPISYIVGAVLFLFLSFQCILIVGSIKIINTTDYYEVQITRIVDSIYDASDDISLREADDILKEIIDRYPILQYYIEGGEFTGYTAKTLPHGIANALKSFMRWYIFRRLLWCLAFVAVGAYCVIKTMSKQYGGPQRRSAIRRESVHQKRKRISRTRR